MPSHGMASGRHGMVFQRPKSLKYTHSGGYVTDAGASAGKAPEGQNNGAIWTSRKRSPFSGKNHGKPWLKKDKTSNWTNLNLPGEEWVEWSATGLKDASVFDLSPTGHSFSCPHEEIVGVCWIQQYLYIYIYITYLPHKAVAEVSKDKEPIGRGCAEFNWFESQWMSDSNEVRVKWFWLSVDLILKWCGCQLVWDSSDLVVNWFEIQMIWLSIDVWFKWFWLSVDLNFKWGGCQLIWDSSDSVVNWSEIQVIWLSIDLRFKWVGCQLDWDSSDLDVKWFEVQVIWLSTDVCFKWFCQTKLFCETSFENEALKLKNGAFLRDFLQKWSFEGQKRSIEAQKRSLSARLPSKMKLWRSKTKHWSSKTKPFCETSFKNEILKLKNEAFVRDFLQKWSCEDQKRSFCARLPSKMKLWRSKTKLFCETSFKNDNLTRHLTSEFQYVLTIFNWTLQKYCACHEKVEPRHTKSCNRHAKWSLQSNASVTWNLQPFHGFSVQGFKHRHHKARNHCACHAKRIVSEPLQIHHACQRFCNPHELLRLPRILQRVEIPAPATRNTLSTLQKRPETVSF